MTLLIFSTPCNFVKHNIITTFTLTNKLEWFALNISVDKQTPRLQIDDSSSTCPLLLPSSPSKPPGYYAVQNPRLVTHVLNTWFTVMQGDRERPAEKVEPSLRASVGSTVQLKQQVIRDDVVMTDIMCYGDFDRTVGKVRNGRYFQVMPYYLLDSNLYNYYTYMLTCNYIFDCLISTVPMIKHEICCN